MKKLLLFFSIILITIASKAQTTATDFNMNDCNGQMHHLFSELDSGNVVILEFFMLSCTPCITAGDLLETLHQSLVSQFGSSKVRFYHFGFSNSYTCSQITNWVTTNGYSSVPFDSGAVQVAYYGGMGMPTVAVVAGNTHKVLFTNTGFATSDTTTISNAVKNFFNPAGIKENSIAISSLNTFPNPVSQNFSINFEAKEPGTLKLELTDLTGRIVQNLAEEKIQTGIWNRSFNINNISSGIYIIRCQLNGQTFSEKITLQ